MARSCTDHSTAAIFVSIRTDGPQVRKLDGRARSGLYSARYSISIADTVKWRARIHFAH
jgi:hypothetical protein